MINLPLTSLIFTSNFSEVAGRETSVTIVETDAGYYVKLVVDDVTRYLTTHANPSMPRMFVDLNRLHKLLRASFVSPITMELEQPGKKKRAKKKNSVKKKAISKRK